MSSHLQRTRQWATWSFAALAISPFMLCFPSSGSGDEGPELSRVTGRVTIAGQPVRKVYICLDRGDAHEARGWLWNDGTFQLENSRWGEDGTLPDRYQAHLFTHEPQRFPSKYLDARTAGIVLNVARGWNHFSIQLP